MVKTWVVATSNEIEKYFFDYFKQMDICLTPEMLNKSKKLLTYSNFDSAIIDSVHVDYTQKIAIPFSNGTLYIYPQENNHEFKPNHWEKRDYSVYRIEYDFSEDC